MFSFQCLAPDGMYCPTRYEFPLAYLLLDADIQHQPHIASVLEVFFLAIFKNVASFIIMFYQALNGENRKSVCSNLQRFHNALQVLGATESEVNQLWTSVARVLDFENGLFAKLRTHLKSTLNADIEISGTSESNYLTPFNDVRCPSLNAKRSHYFNAVHIVTLILQRYLFKSVICSMLDINSKFSERSARM